MKPETIIKLIAVLMILYGVNLKTNILSFNLPYYEQGQVIKAETVGTSSFSTQYFYRSRGQTNTLRVLLQNGKTIPIDIGQQPLPKTGSYVQLKVREKLFGVTSYELVDGEY